MRTKSQSPKKIKKKSPKKNQPFLKLYKYNIYKKSGLKVVRYIIYRKK